MKNKKLLKLLAAITLGAATAGAIGLCGCSQTHTHTFDTEKWKNDDPSGHWHEATCEHTDERGDFAEHSDADGDGLCDVCEYRMVTIVEFTVKFHMNDHGTQIKDVKVDENGKLVKPEDPTDDAYNFLGWFIDEELKTPYNFELAVTGDLNLYASWTHKHKYDNTKWEFDSVNHYHSCTVDGCTEIIQKGNHTIENNECTVCHAKFKQALYNFQPSKLEAGTYADGLASGIFSLVPDAKVRTRERLNQKVYKHDAVIDDNNPDESQIVENSFSNTIFAEDGETKLFGGKSVQMDGKARGFAVNAIAPGTLTFYAENGSSSVKADQYQKLLLTKPDGTTEELSYLGSKIRAVVVQCDQIGTYTITRGSGSTTDVYFAKFEAVVPVTDVEKIEIAEKGKVEYTLNQDLDYSKLQVNIVRKTTGMIEPLDLTSPGVTIDSHEFDNSKSGTYKIVVKYKDENDKEFTADYEVTVFAVEALELGFNVTIQGLNNSAGNQTYINHAVQQFYFKGQEFDADGLTVRTVLNNGKLKPIVTEGFSISGFDKNTAGKQTVTVTWNDDTAITATFEVYVADYAASSIGAALESITLNVNGDLSDSLVGTLDSGAYRFKTIQQAIDFLDAVRLDENTKKVINLAEGVYKEKLEINIPNLTIKGAGSDAAKTVIEWDALYGMEDEGGYAHTTDSTATLSIREKAVGFVIEDVTVSNWYNSTAHFDEKFPNGHGEHRALAILIQADKFVMDNCRLLGYQDTIELFTGRQLIKNTYICGRTDFIFGTNNTTYFYKCTIESIESKGYITAFKGMNKSTSDSVTYGAIFDDCDFTCSQGVEEGSTAIGRPWGACAAVAVINSRLGKHISKAGYAGGTSGTRYVSMSGTAPTVATAKFFEYNNTGVGALVYTAEDQDKDATHVAGTSYEVAGMKLLSAADAANYSDLSVIFGTTNGNVSYATEWDGGKGVVITEKTYKFSDYFVSGDSYNTPHTATDEEIFGGDAKVTGEWAHELNQKKDHAKFLAGAEIKFTVKGTVSVTTFNGNYGLLENVIISYKDGYATLKIVATASSPIANGCYITLIKVNKVDIPVDSEINYSFVTPGADNVSGTVAEPAELFDGDVEVVGNMRNNNNSYQITGGTVLKFKKRGQVSFEWYPGYGNDSNAVVFYSDGYAEVTITGNPYLVSITLDTSVKPSDSKVIFSEDKVIDLTALSTKYEGNTGRYEGVEIDATNGKFANNNSGWIQMNAGTVLKVSVAEGIAVSVTEYQDAGKITVGERDADGVVTITATENTYIKALTFTIEKLYANDAVVNLTDLKTAYEGNTGSYKGIKIDATNGKFANNNGGWIQMNTGTILKVHVGEGIVVSVTEYNNAGQITVGERDAQGWVTITATGNTYISEIKMTLPLVRITQNYTYTYSQGDRTDGTLEIGDTNIKFENCKVNNSWLAYGTIKLDVARDATITIKGSQYDGDILINGAKVEHTVDGNYWMYTFYVNEAAEGVVTITSTKGYLAGITVSFD